MFGIFTHSWFKPAAFALVAIAAAIKSIAPPNTIAYHIADQIIGYGVMAGIASDGIQKKDN